MNGTPRLRSAYPTSPGSTPKKHEQHAKPSGLQSPRPPIPPAAPSQENASPMIPFTLVDAPSQRLYVLIFYAALNIWRLSDFFGLMNEEQESLWLFMKWLLIDSIFLYGLPEFQIPWLQWSSTTTAMLVILHTVLNAFLMFRIPVCPARTQNSGGRCSQTSRFRLKHGLWHSQRSFTTENLPSRREVLSQHPSCTTRH